MAVKIQEPVASNISLGTEPLNDVSTWADILFSPLGSKRRCIANYSSIRVFRRRCRGYHSAARVEGMVKVQDRGNRQALPIRHPSMDKYARLIPNVVHFFPYAERQRGRVLVSYFLRGFVKYIPLTDLLKKEHTFDDLVTIMGMHPTNTADWFIIRYVRYITFGDAWFRVMHLLRARVKLKPTRRFFLTYHSFSTHLTDILLGPWPCAFRAPISRGVYFESSDFQFVRFVKRRGLVSQYLVLYETQLVILKVIEISGSSERIRDMLHEVHIYEVLAELQGRSIPRFAFHGFLDESAYCLGIHLGVNCLSKLKDHQKDKLQRSLRRIHHAGVTLNRLSRSNIHVDTAGVPYLVEFRSATKLDSSSARDSDRRHLISVLRSL